MPIIIDPNLAYLLWMLALLLLSLAVVSPGTGFLELAALFLLLFVGLAALTLPINIWAVVLMLLGGVPLLLYLRPRSGGRDWRLLAGGLGLLLTGSALLFSQEDSWLPAVHPLLIGVASLGLGGFFWWAGQRSLEAISAPPFQNIDQIIGQEGETRTDLQTQGTVYVAGELWTASSNKPTKSGARVRVIGREGFHLIVEPVE